MVESAIFLDRVVTLMEADADREKWESLYCGAMFPARTTPRRFGIYGVAKRGKLLSI